MKKTNGYCQDKINEGEGWGEGGGREGEKYQEQIEVTVVSAKELPSVFAS